jgi:hypothetical protein
MVPERIIIFASFRSTVCVGARIILKRVMIDAENLTPNPFPSGKGNRI